MAADPTIQEFFSAALLAVGIGCFGLGCLFLFGRRKAKVADQEMRETWDGYMAETPSTLPEWDGDTYDWPETGLVRYLEATDTRTTAPQPVWPVPASDISGPLPTQPLEPEYDPAADAEAYIDSMTADTTAFLARLGADE
jgi:hypothetical protein